jgi:DNA-binding transcriptional LysR family regulator
MLINACEYILEIHQKGSFSRAAESLHVTQPALSVAVKRFEDKMGFTVFDRSKFPLRLTPDGEQCVKTLQEIVCLKDELLYRIQERYNRKQGRLAIASTGYYCAYQLLDILEKFKKRYPGYSVQLHEFDMKNVEEELAKKYVDVFISAKKMNPEGYVSQKIFSEHLVLAVPAAFSVNKSLEEYKLTFEQVLNISPTQKHRFAPSADHFRDLPFLLLQNYNDTSIRAEKIFKRSGFSPRVVMRLDQMLTTFYVAAAGLGAAFVRTELLRHVEPTNKLFFYEIDDADMTRPVMVYGREHVVKSEIYRDFLRFFDGERSKK